MKLYYTDQRIAGYLSERDLLSQHTFSNVNLSGYYYPTGKTLIRFGVIWAEALCRSGLCWFVRSSIQ